MELGHSQILFSHEGRCARFSHRCRGLCCTLRPAVAGDSKCSPGTILDVVRVGGEQSSHSLECLVVKRDVTRKEDLIAAMERTMAAFGKLDIAFNNAGVEQPSGAVDQITEASHTK